MKCLGTLNFILYSLLKWGFLFQTHDLIERQKKSNVEITFCHRAFPKFADILRFTTVIKIPTKPHTP